jgi:hypothetical protein
MRLLANLVAVCFLASAFPILAVAQCGPNMEKQLAEVRESWVKNWNEKQLDRLANLYQPHADLLSADGSRVLDRQGIRASLEKHVGSRFEMRSVGVACSDGLAFDTGTYIKDEDGKRIEGSYLMVLVYFPEASKWLITQHALTAKPSSTF